MKINRCSKLVCNFYDKKICSSHKNFETNIKSWISIKKVHKIIEFNLEAWLKPYIDMNTELRKKQKMNLRKTFLS